MTTSHSSSSDWLRVRSRLAELVQSDDASAVESLAEEFPYVKVNQQLWLDCIYTEFCLREDQGQSPSPDMYVSRFPAHAEELRKLFEIHAEIDRPSLAGRFNGNGSGFLELNPSAISTNPTIRASQTTDPEIAGDSAGSAPTGMIGGYQILGRIASGGMGVVYKAYQPQLDRIAAIKLIKTGGLADEGQARRFELEARAAARLDHPGIVPVYEIGKQDGRLFLAMAFVEGESLWQKVQAAPLEPKQAARIMQQVAEAIQFAHVQGIVHRDLKPQNILLTKNDQPRVTDFGLAKHQDSESSLTGTGDVLGTPSYMPPEQASGKIDQISPLSDVYALGATLYAVVTGRPPFQAASTVDTLVQVLHEEPIPPRALNPAIPVDLETICLKSLQKDPARRYASAQAFADDLLRFQKGEAILARPVGRSERTWRWCRKNPAIATLSTAATLLLLTVTVVSSMAYLRERRFAAEKEILARQESQLREQAEKNAAENERLADEANLEREKAVQSAAEKTRIADEKSEVSNFLVTLFRTSDPLDFDGIGLREDREGELTASEILELALQRLSAPQNAGKSKTIRATLLDTLGDVQRSRGELESAEKLLTEAKGIWDEILEPDDPARSNNLLCLGKLFFIQGRYHEAEDLFRQSLSLREPRRKDFPLEAAEVEFQLALLFSETNLKGYSPPMLRSIIETYANCGIKDSPSLERVKLALMLVLIELQRHEEAMQINIGSLSTKEIGQLFLQKDLGEQLRRAGKYVEAANTMTSMIEAAENRLGKDHPLLFFAHLDQADILSQKGDYASSVEEFQKAVRIADLRLGEHPSLIDPGLRFAEQMLSRGNFKDAERLARRVRRLTERPVSGYRVNIGRADSLIASILAAQGRYEEAEFWARKGLEDSERVSLEPVRFQHVYDGCARKLVGLLADQGKYAEAEEYFRACQPQKTIAESDWQQLAMLLRQQGKLAEAIALETPNLSEIRSDAKVHPWEGSAMAFRYRADVLSAYEDHAGAEAYFRQAAQRARSEFPPGHPELALNLWSWGKSLILLGNAREAEPAIREAIDINRQAYGPNSEIILTFQMSLAEAVWMLNNPDDARRLAREAFEQFRALHGDGHPRLIERHADYAQLCKLFGDLDIAETHYRTAVDLTAKIFPPAHPLRWKTVPALADVLIAAGKPAEAKELLTAYLAETTPLLPEKSPRLVELRERIGHIESR